MPGEFVDSNILLYLTSSDSERSDCAAEVISRRPLVSVQVLNEVTNVTRYKFRRSWAEVSAFLDRLAPFLSVYPLTEAMHRHALHLVQRYSLSWWDALIVAAACALECDTLYSEDMHDGLVIDDRLRIKNPFRDQNSR